PGVRVSAEHRRIHREEGNYPIQSMCRWVKVSKSGYYAWRNRPESSTTRRREDLTAIIVKFFDESEQTCGYRRIHAELARSGVMVSLGMVRKIMAEAGLVACQLRKQARTTVPAPDFPGRPDRLRRDFTATAPGMKWVGDITYIPTWQGFAYLAVVMDCFSKKIIGHAIAGRMRTGLVTEALAMAVRNCPPIRGVTVFHSDRGARCTSAGCTGFMTDRGVLPSVGQTGSCCDNAIDSTRS
ncbi:IS3 family transposase, partial [Propionibacterium acidifaciens]